MAQTRTFSQLVADQVAAVQGAAAGLVDFNVGSILRAFVEAVALVALWLQGLILALLAATRASTATGVDLDTWMADFGLTREAAFAARGDVTFSRFSTSGEALVSLGATVETVDGSQSFAVVVDTTNLAWSAVHQAYVMSPGVGQVTVPVVAVIPGAAGNVAAGVVTVLTGAMPGIDTVVNSASFFSGSDPESDAAFRARFHLFIASLSKATRAAVDYAIASLEQNLTHTLVENETYDGEVRRGHFYVIVDDGTGTPTSETLALVAAAIEQVRPVGISFGVFAPVIVPVTVSLAVKLVFGADATAVKAAVAGAIEQHIDGLVMGAAVNLTRIAQLAYDASPDVTNVTNIQLNGVAADIAVAAQQRPVLNVVTVATS
ncbi:MAG: baseplate J/gp47 family protein [Vitreimonas sp.]